MFAVSKIFQVLAHNGASLRIRVHDLPHSYATLALASGVNPRIVSGRLGHATVALTLDVYSHVLPQQDHEAASAIADLCGRPPKKNLARAVLSVAVTGGVGASCRHSVDNGHYGSREQATKNALSR